MEDGEDKISAPFCDLYERAVVHLVEFIIYEIKITKEYLFFSTVCLHQELVNCMNGFQFNKKLIRSQHSRI